MRYKRILIFGNLVVIYVLLIYIFTQKESHGSKERKSGLHMLSPEQQGLLQQQGILQPPSDTGVSMFDQKPEDNPPKVDDTFGFMLQQNQDAMPDQGMQAPQMDPNVFGPDLQNPQGGDPNMIPGLNPPNPDLLDFNVIGQNPEGPQQDMGMLGQNMDGLSQYDSMPDEKPGISQLLDNALQMLNPNAETSQGGDVYFEEAPQKAASSWADTFSSWFSQGSQDIPPEPLPASDMQNFQDTLSRMLDQNSQGQIPPNILAQLEDVRRQMNPQDTAGFPQMDAGAPGPLSADAPYPADTGIDIPLPGIGAPNPNPWPMPQAGAANPWPVPQGGAANPNPWPMPQGAANPQPGEANPWPVPQGGAANPQPGEDSPWPVPQGGAANPWPVPQGGAVNPQPGEDSLWPVPQGGAAQPGEENPWPVPQGAAANPQAGEDNPWPVPQGGAANPWPVPQGGAANPQAAEAMPYPAEPGPDQGAPMSQDGAPMPRAGPQPGGSISEAALAQGPPPEGEEFMKKIVVSAVEKNRENITAMGRWLPGMKHFQSCMIEEGRSAISPCCGEDVKKMFFQWEDESFVNDKSVLEEFMSKVQGKQVVLMGDSVMENLFMGLAEVFKLGM